MVIHSFEILFLIETDLNINVFLLWEPKEACYRGFRFACNIFLWGPIGNAIAQHIRFLSSIFIE